MILTLNAGSSSLKFALYPPRARLASVWKGSISGIGTPKARFRAHDSSGGATVDHPLAASLAVTDAAGMVFDWLAALGLADQVTSVAHRIVHGGRRFTQPQILNATALGELRAYVPLAPLHQPYNLDIVELAQRRFASQPQIGCFDTAFHAARPALDRLYALPKALSEDGLVAYGFHGLSYGYIADELKNRFGEAAGGRAIVAHLGSGASLCAMQAGGSVATTMGFSALEGLVMSTRCGALDPGLVLHLILERGMPAEEVSAMLYHGSGLLGVSGVSGDMQSLLESTDPGAAAAVDLFVYRIVRAIGSLTAALGGLDTLVFTAGIGEHAAAIRARICQGCAWLGLTMDGARNAAAAVSISAPESSVAVLVIPTDEEAAMAKAVIALPH